MSEILAVFGATGQKGGPVVSYVLNDPELSKKYKICAITSDVNRLQYQRRLSEGEILLAPV